MKLLKERDVPPAKIYFPAKARKKDIYEIVGERALESGRSSEEANKISLFCLFKIFGRAVFEEEFKRTGIRDEPLGKIATNEERQEAKKFLTSTGFKIANSNRAFIPVKEFPEIYLEILEGIISEDYGLSHLVKETKQTILSI